MKLHDFNSLRAVLLIATCGSIATLSAAETPPARENGSHLPPGQTVILSTGPKPYLWFHKEGMIGTMGKSLDDAYADRCKRFDPALEWAGGFTRDFGPFGIPATGLPAGFIAAAATLDWLADNVIAVKEGLQKGVSRAQVKRAERSEERRVGKECTSWCRSRWSPYH